MTYFGNIIAPAFAGALFLFYYIFFRYVYKDSRGSHFFFSLFLLTFSLFVFTRPVQLMCGPHPMPLIIADIRMFSICAIVAPTYYLFSASLRASVKRKTMIRVYSLGTLFGVIYVIFHTLGTEGSYRILQIGDMSFYDNNVPSFLPPFYGREVSQAMQIVVPIVFFMGALFQNIFSPRTSSSTITPKSMFFINASIFIFASSMITGGFLKQWMIYYAASIPGVILVGYGVLLNIREMRDKLDRLIPVIKEELLQDPSFILSPQVNTEELIAASGLTARPDTFILCNFDDQSPHKGSFFINDELRNKIIRILDDSLGIKNYLLISLGRSGIGICCALGHKKNPEHTAMDLAESLRTGVESGRGIIATIGIGCTYSDMSQLRFSYKEAFLAQEYASRIGKNIVVYYKGIQEIRPELQYPLQAKEKFLSELRMGNKKTAMEALDLFIENLIVLSENDIPGYKMRLIEAAVFASETLISAGINCHPVFNLERSFIEEIGTLKDIPSINALFKKLINVYILKIVDMPVDRSDKLLEKAKAYILSNFKKNITVDSIVQSLHVSHSHIMRIFREREGITLNNFLTQIRIDYARDLLANSSKNITEIAFESGFNDSNYFSTVFNKYLKQTPSEYRAAVKNRG